MRKCLRVLQQCLKREARIQQQSSLWLVSHFYLSMFGKAFLEGSMVGFTLNLPGIGRKMEHRSTPK
ncbi:MAG TPA: hypothetical protein DDY59_07900 [Lachnospiraceae bacterium]|nr:hypothetical protein [Lachnospiraceae bacterium]HCM14282.1 hypothetical protein [Lachnospiraceae bacterium]HCR40189.1 hypothetical protein [Lachnospiraceae bacterium]